MLSSMNTDIALFMSENEYNFPVLSAFQDKVSSLTWIDFETAKSKRINNSNIHFYINDCKFQSIWNTPKRYINFFQRQNLIIMPDFSLYFDFPVALQIFNKYRNHWLMNYFSFCGCRFIPNVSVSTPDNYSWLFIGYPINSVLAFSDIGSYSYVSSRSVILKSYDEMVKRLSPKQILYFTRNKTFAPSEADIIILPYIKGSA